MANQNNDTTDPKAPDPFNLDALRAPRNFHVSSLWRDRQDRILTPSFYDAAVDWTIGIWLRKGAFVNGHH